MTTEILQDKEIQLKMKAGVDKLANAVKATLGPGGRNVIIRPDMPPHTPKITKDGVTVADIINLQDKYEDMGAQLVKMAAQKTHLLAGDGTTTSTLLAQVIISEGLKVEGNPVDIKKGIDKAVACVVESLKKQSRPVTAENLVQIATIAANNDEEIGKIVADAIHQTGNDGVVYIKASKTTETYIELTQGIQIERGYISHYFVTDPGKMETVFDNPIILFSERKISNLKDIQRIMEIAMGNKCPLLIIAEDIDGDALSTLIANSIKFNRTNHGFKMCAIKQPGFGNMQLQMFDDVAIMTGGMVVSEHRGHAWPKVDASFFGSADKVIITQHKTSIIGAGKGAEKVKEATDQRIEEIRALIANAANEQEADKLKKLRLAKLTNGTGIIHVGGQTDVEIAEKIDRVDDAKRATYAAIAEGVVPGGGLAYLNCIVAMEDLTLSNNDEITGMGIIVEALQEPTRQILANAGVSGDIIPKLANVGAQVDYGYNAKTLSFENFFETGIIDPCKVSRVALENAASVGAMFLTTAAGIVDVPNK